MGWSQIVEGLICPADSDLMTFCEQGEWGHRSCARGSQAQEADGPWGWGDEPGSAQLLKFRQEESKAINIECKYHGEGKPWSLKSEGGGEIHRVERIHLSEKRKGEYSSVLETLMEFQQWKCFWQKIHFFLARLNSSYFPPSLPSLSLLLLFLLQHCQQILHFISSGFIHFSFPCPLVSQYDFVD